MAIASGFYSLSFWNSNHSSFALAFDFNILFVFIYLFFFILQTLAKIGRRVFVTLLVAVHCVWFGLAFRFGSILS